MGTMVTGFEWQRKWTGVTGFIYHKHSGRRSPHSLFVFFVKCYLTLFTTHSCMTPPLCSPHRRIFRSSRRPRRRERQVIS